MIQEEDTISYSEYRRLLIGLNGETPLGYVVQIRSETDSKKIKEMTQKEKEIRREWQEFKNSQNIVGKETEVQKEKKVQDVQEMLRAMFGGVKK